MGVGINPERGERAERAAGGRPERTPDPGTELLVGHAAETDVFSGRRPEAGSAPERESRAWSGAGGTATARPPSLTRTAPARPFFSDGPAFEDSPSTALLPDAAPDLDRPPPASWENPGGSADGNDPDEVTIQLDGAGLGPLARPGKDVPATAEISEGPVFVDESGRRSRRYRRLGMLVAVACAVYAVVIVATLLSGNSNAPWLPVPGQEEDTPAGQVESSPLPTQSVNRSGKGATAAPAAVATAADGRTPSRGTATTAAASAGASAASSDPKPSTSATKKPKPGVTTKAPAPDPEPSSSADGQPTASAPATTPGTVAPTESTGTTGSNGAGAGT
ncbi:hypothetical protein ABZV29_10825 [Streptomyces sp. NPDC005236]|uniref:hypothetical protein n=1 Tax=Streptomyces sp. NPDC005236 TaxID=3157028 RepID=UPI0033B9DC67